MKARLIFEFFVRRIVLGKDAFGLIEERLTGLTFYLLAA